MTQKKHVFFQPVQTAEQRRKRNQKYRDNSSNPGDRGSGDLLLQCRKIKLFHRAVYSTRRRLKRSHGRPWTISMKRTSTD